MTTHRWRILDRLAGPVLLSWPTFWLVLALSFVLTGLSSTRLFLIAPWSTSLAVVVGQLALFSTLAVGMFALRHSTPRQRSAWAIPLIALGSAARGVGVAIALSTLDVQAPLWPLRIGGSMLSISLVVILVVLVVDSVHEHRTLMTEYVTRNAELQQTRERVHLEITERHREVVERVRRELLSHLDAMTGRSPADVRDALRRTAEDVVRPLSHKLAQQTTILDRQLTQTPSRRIDWRAIAADAALGRAIPTLPLAVAMITIGATWSFIVFPPRSAFTLLVTGLITIWLLSTLANVVLHRISTRIGPFGRSVVMTLLLVVVGLLTALAALITLAPDPLAVTVAASDAILIPVLGWLFAGARAAQNQRLRMEQAMRDTHEALTWEVARAGETQWQQRRALSRALHGPVQSAIGSAAVRLDLALQSGEPTDALVEDLRRHVVESIDVLGVQQPPMTLGAAVAQLTSMYEGACAISLQASAKATERLAADPPCAAASTDIVNEAVWNAIRHGKAKHVDVEVRSDDANAVRIMVKDDGTTRQPVTATARGLGTQMLDEVSLEWSRTHTAAGTTLLVVLPVA